MKYLYFLVVIFLTTLAVHGQEKKSRESFINDFTKALDKNFSEDDLNKMFRDYSDLLTPHSDVTQLSQRLQGNTISIYPLSDFKNYKIYADNINNLLNSANQNQEILAYLVIAASGDISKEDFLLNRIVSEKEKGHLLWAGMALLYFNCEHTTPLFDFLVKYEDFGDAHMLPMYIKLNKDSLQQTAYNRINGDNVKAKVLAAQILSVTSLNAKTELILIQAVKNWDFNIKGYAIYSINKLKIGNLLQTFKPLLDSPQTRSIALEALANSPTIADHNYLIELVNKQNTISEDLLNSFYQSENGENIKYWLKLLYSKSLPKNYVFFVFKQPLVRSDDILPELQRALQKVKNPEILAELVRALEDRTDDTSIDLMIGFLKNQNSTVRYWTAKTLENNSSNKLKNENVKSLLNKGLEDGNR
jgi:HEAT repeat protein